MKRVFPGRDTGQYAWHYVIVERALLAVFKEPEAAGLYEYRGAEQRGDRDLPVRVMCAQTNFLGLFLLKRKIHKGQPRTVASVVLFDCFAVSFGQAVWHCAST